jgi:hypothetical protein
MHEEAQKDNLTNQKLLSIFCDNSIPFCERIALFYKKIVEYHDFFIEKHGGQSKPKRGK